MTRCFSRTLAQRVFSRRACLCRYSSRQSRFFSHNFYSTLSPTSFQYGYIEGVEDLEDYKPGGYHPIHIDDRLHQRYCIVHKLGRGTFSTVWLALDDQTLKYAAVKVGTADADMTGSPAADKASMVPPAIDRFCITGPNGTHPCFVTSPASCSLRDSKAASDWCLFQLDITRSLCAQLAMAVCFIHSEGYAHGGACYFSDFGVAFRPSDKSCFESQTPLRMRAPEAFFEPTTLLSFPTDIWSLGCAIFELLGHRSLIDGSLAPPDEITTQQVHLWFDDAGRPLGDECDIWSWDRRFEEWLQELRRYSGMDVIGEEEKAALLDLLHWMLAWKPEERPSAEEVLDTVWMKKLVLPEYEQGRKAWV
ncbi:kinase-like protein [Xylaria digitata]|nr:kinase-like protein [Xylaria digitata]